MFGGKQAAEGESFYTDKDVDGVRQSLIDTEMVNACNFLLWRKLKKCILDQRPQDWFKWAVLIACLVIVYKQLLDGCSKLTNPPIATYSKLALNDSMYYPALTVCREPPYNKKVFPKFNFSTDHIGPFPYTSQWKYYPYHLYNISDFWEEAVYMADVFTSASLNQTDITTFLTSSIHLQSGMCHTFTPNITVSEVGKKSGYSLLLNHDLYDYKPLEDDEPGWKIYVHEPREKFSENINFLASRQDPVFVPVGEITEVSIDAYQFNVLSNCSDEESYSVTECEENCTIAEDIAPFMPCTGPWFPQIKKPYCSDFDGMRVLLRASYVMTYKHCCINKCKTTYYKIFVVKRTPGPPERSLTSTVLVYFSSKAVIAMEERFSYNWNDFLGEIGGSVGFLLGLSIVGVIGIMGKVIRFFCYSKEEKSVEMNKTFVSTKATDVQVAVIQ